MQMQRAAIMCVHFRDCDWLNCPEKRAIHLLNDMPPGGQKTVRKICFSHGPRSSAAAGAYRPLIVTRPHDAAPSYTDVLHVCFPARECKHNSVGGEKTSGHTASHARAENLKTGGVLEKSFVACFILPFPNEWSANYSMRHQPQRAGKRRAVSRFSGNDHLTHRQKGPRAHRAECLMSVFTVSLPCLTLSAVQQGVTEYRPASGKAAAEHRSELQTPRHGHVSGRMRGVEHQSILTAEQMLICCTACRA